MWTSGSVHTALLILLLGSASTHASGVRSFKSGPIQVTADGAAVWIANEHADSVSRLAPADDSVIEHALPDPETRHAPKGIAVSEDGARIWVACHDSDRIYVLNADGTLLQRIDLPWGSGPYSVAISRPSAPDGAQHWALVTLHRAGGLAAIDTTTFAVTILSPVYHSPLGIAFAEDGVSAWITHLFANDEHPRLSRVDFSNQTPTVTTRIEVGAATPRHTGQLNHADASRNVAEGGYLNFRGHLAQLPSAATGNLQQIWIPTQYHNMTQDLYSPDSTMQASVRKLDLSTREISIDDKIVFTAVHVHNPTTGDNNPAWQGYGWGARFSGAVDLGFSMLGGTLHGLVVGEQSNDVVVFPWNTGPIRSTTDPAAPGLPEVPVGDRPMGIAVSPTEDVAFVYNALSFDVSVLDLSDPASPVEDRRIVVSSPLPSTIVGSPALLNGARLFHTSDDPRISSNQKVACASCHINAEHDGRVWAFHNLPPGSLGQGHGPRAAPSLLGIGRTHTPGQLDPDFDQLGQLHRSGDRDEVQDFEHTFQSVTMGGTGFLGAGVQTELGPPNAGLDADLDDLAEYVLALAPLSRSPFRAEGGGLSEAAQRGATFFRGNDLAGHAADAQCASCHVPTTGFVDHRFHDVGQRRDGNEQELNSGSRPCNWCVNTTTLVGVWATAPYGGVLKFTESFLDTLLDFGDPARSTLHGNIGGLTGRQLSDLAEFVLSVDGNMTDVEVQNARDVDPPRIVRVAPTSPTRIEVWFDEAVESSSAGDPANYRLTRLDNGAEIAITGAARDPQNGDRVSLSTAPLAASCNGVDYRLEPAGPLLDLANTASGGAANAVVTQDPVNRHEFLVGDTLTVTLGASGYENMTVRVHDVSPVGPGLSTWGHDSIKLFDSNGSINPGFLRFEWRDPMIQLAGVASSADLVDAQLSLQPEEGDAQPIELRRVLQPWDDPVNGRDWNNNPVGAPTWRDHRHPNQRWNQTGARALGSSGDDPTDYDGAFDLAGAVDAMGVMSAINQPVVFGGAGVTDAFRFWFDHPAQDYGYAMRVQETPPIRPVALFHRGEAELMRHAPVLTLTYQLPVGLPPETAPAGSAEPLRLSKNGADVLLSFGGVGALASAYNIYEGSVGSWYSHDAANCSAVPVINGNRLELPHSPQPGDRYFLVTAADCSEGTAGFDSSSNERDPLRLSCQP